MDKADRKFSKPQQENFSAEERTDQDKSQRGASRPQTRGEGLGGEGEPEEEDQKRK